MTLGQVSFWMFLLGLVLPWSCVLAGFRLQDDGFVNGLARTLALASVTTTLCWFVALVMGVVAARKRIGAFLGYVFGIGSRAGDRRMIVSPDAKLIASAIFIAAGGLCVAIAELGRGGIGLVLGVILLLVGVPMLVIQWRSGKRYPGPVPDDSDTDIDTGFKATKDLEI